MRAACLVAGLMALSLTVVSAADNWPHFRGPTGGVVADDPMLPEVWDTKENVAWKVPVPGLGWGARCLGRFGLRDRRPRRRPDPETGPGDRGRSDAVDPDLLADSAECDLPLDAVRV